MSRINPPDDHNKTPEGHSERRGESVHPIEAPKSPQAQASAWLAKMDGRDLNDTEQQAFKDWVNADEAHILAFRKVIAAWDDLNILTKLPQVLEQRSQHQRAEQSQEQKQEQKEPPRWRATIAIAATVMLSLFVTFKYNSTADSQATYTTAVGEQKTITLPDNSRVQLNTNSRLKIDYSDSHRAIYLHQGEAHFDVQSNPQRPFEVYAGSGRVRAIGTAFSVTLYEQDIGVIVTEGIVEIAPEIITQLAAAPSQPAEQGAPLSNANAESEPDANKSQTPTKSKRVKAGNAAVFNQHSVKHIQAIADDEMQRRLAWQQGLLIFSGEPLEEVVKQLSRYTDTKILIKSENARNLRIGGQFQAGDTKAVFSALEKGFGLKADYITNNLVYLYYKE